MGHGAWGMGQNVIALCALRYAKNKGGCYERGGKDLYDADVPLLQDCNLSFA
jgi:hypothetical protein